MPITNRRKTRGNLHAYKAIVTRSRTVWTNTETEGSACMSHRIGSRFYIRQTRNKKNWFSR